ncbi:mediator of RNA polymerase II transcription subunit [Striga asiatica]|uniref:Mediator of RNA polymerase II transcription subunit 13 n=1 Tax=Striga asiatica TaxID=4170 RepID=A0A5A7QZ55_STRAF|nr:mediator of RNA polymerase II transcription subunit [Striga asiatica]
MPDLAKQDNKLLIYIKLKVCINDVPSIDRSSVFLVSWLHQRLGGLHQISWFQFLPHDYDFSTAPDKSLKGNQKDVATWEVLSAHLQLQKEGFLSSWTNSFVGPWDPSQGLHNPDEKIKLWLFLPGQHSSIVEKAQPAVAKLRVLASGLWVAPGDSEEVAAALCQALRNCIESRALRGLSYVRFGDVFSKYHPFTQNEELFRKGQPVAEFIFAATEDTIFVHVIISAKHVRALSSGDIEPFLRGSSRRSSGQISESVSFILPIRTLPYLSWYQKSTRFTMLSRKQDAANDRCVAAIYNLSRRTEWFGRQLETMGREIADLSAEIGDIRLTIRTMVRDKQMYHDAMLLGIVMTISDVSDQKKRKKGGGRDGDQNFSDTIKEFMLLSLKLIYIVSVVVSPHGMRGKLTGYCPGDLVKQVYLSTGKVRGSNGIVGLPYSAAQVLGLPSQMRGQNCFVEVTLGCNDQTLQKDDNSHSDFSQPHGTESLAAGLGTQRWPSTKPPVTEQMFVYPAEAVLVPVFQTSFARSSLKRFWLQNWVGPSLTGSSLFMHCDDKLDSRGGSSFEPSGTYRSSSNSNSSSNCTISSSSSDSDNNTLGTGDLDADADSLMSRQSGLSSLGQMQNDGRQLGSKRPRIATSESFGQGGMVLNPSMTDYGTMEVNNISSSGVANEQIGPEWGWDDDRGSGMDIQALLSEFGDFGDFFLNDALPFGEPPGDAESQAPMFPAPEGGDLCSSPSNSVMDVSDQMLLPVAFPTLDSFNHLQAAASVEDLTSKNQEALKNTASGQVTSTLPSVNREFDHVVKAEALMTFAPEYGCVEAPRNDISSVIIRSPYVPKSCKVDSASSSNNYVYSATPPSSPCCDGSDEKLPTSLKARTEKNDASSLLRSKNYYTHVDCGKKQYSGTNNGFSKAEAGGASSQFKKTGNAVSTKAAEVSLREDTFLPSSRTVLATGIECLVCQASMCRLRHTLLSPSNLSLSGLSGLPGNSTPSQIHADSSTIMDSMSSRSEFKKKEIIPARLAGDIDGGMREPLTAPVGVWRSVGIPKSTKTSTSTMEVGHSMPNNSFIEENILSYGLRQPLHELLDSFALLVQQAASFVDVALDSDCSDGPYCWLALQEQKNRGFSCGPSMVHAGCGGLLASCHSLDIAGVELVDPLSADVLASLTISLLQSDIKAALKSAFSNVDGPLSVTDWCRGRSASIDSGMACDGVSVESIASASECRDSVTVSVGEAMSPSLASAGGGSGLKTDGARMDESATSTSELDQQQCSRIRPTLSVVPFPSILVGYQDDWLKTSASSLHVWEKAPLEPYATAKHMSYYVVCPNIDPLISAAGDFFLQLGTDIKKSVDKFSESCDILWCSLIPVYETCKLGTHAPQSLGNEMEIDSGKISPGFVFLDCPQSVKIDSNNASMLGSISDYFLCLSNGWDLTSYLKTLSKALKTLKLGSSVSMNTKEGNGGQCTVVYVVCPFPEPLAVLQTVVESSVAIGSVIRSSDRERRTMLHNQVAKALSYPSAVDESFSNVLTLTGFSIPKLVLQIVTVDAIFRVTSPSLNELVILKEIAFTVYNKARRISRGPPGETTTMTSSSLVQERSHSVVMPMTSPVPGMWKDCAGPRMMGPPLQRESDLDAMRQGSWDNSWQNARDSNKTTGDSFPQNDIRCLFEPLFILAEPGSLDRGLSPFVVTNPADPSKPLSDDCVSTSFVQSSTSGSGDNNGSASQHDSTDSDSFGSGNRKLLPSLHCCYGWTEDWRWMVCIWTDSRGELLDSYVYPFGGVSSRQDTKGLQSIFIQILQQGCQILQSCSPDLNNVKPRDLVITRIGCFFELECQEWQKALYSAWGPEVKKWSLQLRRSAPDGVPAASNGNPLQQQEMNMMQERVIPSSPSPLYSSHSKGSSGFMKGGQNSSRKQIMSGHSAVDNSKGLLHWVQSISFVCVSIDHSLQLVYQADSNSPGTSQGSSTTATSAQSISYLEGYTPVKSLGSTPSSYILIPSPTTRFLPPPSLQLPTVLTASSPPLAHLLHSRGSAAPLSTGFAVSRAVPSARRAHTTRDEWPSVLSVSLVDYYGGSSHDKPPPPPPPAAGKSGGKAAVKELEAETCSVMESVAAELHALSWMTVSPAYLERRSALPFHCDMVLRLRRLLHFADKGVLRNR